VADERVKPCLRCDGLIPFSDSHCPSCGAFGDPSPTLETPIEEGGSGDGRSTLLAEAGLVAAAAALAGGTFLALAASSLS
jgi:hypothetical protein